MNNEQRQAQADFENRSGIHNTCPGTCMECGAVVTVGMRNKCPHERVHNGTVYYPLGSD